MVAMHAVARSDAFQAPSAAAVPPPELVKTERKREGDHDVVVNTVFDQFGKALFQSKLNSGSGQLSVTDVSQVSDLNDPQALAQQARLVVKLDAHAQLLEKAPELAEVTEPINGEESLHWDLDPAADGSARSISIPMVKTSYSSGDEKTYYTGFRYTEQAAPHVASGQPDQTVAIDLTTTDWAFDDWAVSKSAHAAANAVSVSNRIADPDFQMPGDAGQARWHSQAAMVVATNDSTARRASDGRLAQWDPSTEHRKAEGMPFTQETSFSERGFLGFGDRDGRLVWQTLSGEEIAGEPTLEEKLRGSTGYVERSY